MSEPVTPHTTPDQALSKVHIDVTTVSKLDYLFEGDLIPALQLIVDDDIVIKQCIGKIRDYEESIARLNHAKEEARLEVVEVDVRIKEIEAQLRTARADRNTSLGRVKSIVHSQAWMERLIKGRKQNIRKRQKQLLFMEAKRRLRAIGKEIKMNTGLRGRNPGDDEFSILSPGDPDLRRPMSPEAYESKYGGQKDDLTIEADSTPST